MHMVTTFWPADTERSRAGSWYSEARPKTKRTQLHREVGEDMLWLLPLVHDQLDAWSQGSLTKIQFSTSLSIFFGPVSTTVVL